MNARLLFILLLFTIGALWYIIGYWRRKAGEAAFAAARLTEKSEERERYCRLAVMAGHREACRMFCLVRQAVPSADVRFVDRLRQAQTERRHLVRNQSGYAGHRVHRSGGMSCGAFGQASRRVGRGSGTGTQNRDLHARPCQPVLRPIPA